MKRKIWLFLVVQHGYPPLEGARAQHNTSLGAAVFWISALQKQSFSKENKQTRKQHPEMCIHQAVMQKPSHFTETVR